jgi:DNA-binding NarL/FixJ family response regulator
MRRESLKGTTPETPLQILSTARGLRAELRRGVLAMRSQRQELHERAIEVKAHRESLQRVARLIIAEIHEGDAAGHDTRDSSHPRGGMEVILRTLSPRQRRVLDGVLAGRANKAIAFDLGVSTKTVETHRARVMVKFHVGSLAELVRACMSIARLPPPGRPFDPSRKSV